MSNLTEIVLPKKRTSASGATAHYIGKKLSDEQIQELAAAFCPEVPPYTQGFYTAVGVATLNFAIRAKKAGFAA